MRISILLLFVLIAESCGPANAGSGVSVQVVNANDGTRCYAFFQGDELKGGSCVP